MEDRANQVVFQDLPVSGREYPKDQLPGGIRARFNIDAENIRVVSVGEYDACPCGGTHVVSSGQVGLIKVNQVDRAHGGVRVLFRCGKRALIDYREKERLLGQAASALSMPLGDVPQAVQSTLARLRDLEKDLEEAHEAVLDFQVESRLRALSESGESLVVEAFESLASDRLKYAAKKISESLGNSPSVTLYPPGFRLLLYRLPIPPMPDVVSKIPPGGEVAGAGRLATPSSGEGTSCRVL